MISSVIVSSPSPVHLIPSFPSFPYTSLSIRSDMSPFPNSLAESSYSYSSYYDEKPSLVDPIPSLTLFSYPSLSIHSEMSPFPNFLAESSYLYVCMYVLRREGGGGGFTVVCTDGAANVPCCLLCLGQKLLWVSWFAPDCKIFRYFHPLLKRLVPLLLSPAVHLPLTVARFYLLKALGESSTCSSRSVLGLCRPCSGIFFLRSCG